MANGTSIEFSSDSRLTPKRRKLESLNRKELAIPFYSTNPPFGSRAVRIIPLRRIRGGIERSKPPNILRGYFTPPIGALLGFADEAGILAKCGNHQLRKPFWEYTSVIFSIRKTRNIGLDFFAARRGD